MTTAASISTAPVSMLTFGSASLVSVPANVVGGFVLGPIMFLGMLSLLRGFVSEWLSAPLNVVAGLFIGFLLAVSHFFAGLPGAVYEYQGVTLRSIVVRGPASPRLVGGRRAGGAGRRRSARLRARPPPVAAVRRRDGDAARGGAAPGAGAGAAAGPADADVPGRRRGGGQPAAGARRPDGARRRRPRAARPARCGEHAVERIDLLVLSHGHDDHVGGLEDVVGAVPVQAALLPEPEEPVAVALDEIEDELRAEGTDVRRCATPLDAGRGRLGAAGAAQRAGRRRRPEPEGERRRAGRRRGTCRTATSSCPATRRGRCWRTSICPRASWSAVPHHGSGGGFDAALAGELAPRLAVIPVGENRLRASRTRIRWGARPRRACRWCARTSVATSRCHRGAEV